MRKLLLILALLCPLAHAATYYVSNADGHDTNCTGLAVTPYVSGTSQPCPWKTMAKASGFALAAGDSVLFKGGEPFSTTLKPTAMASGTAGNPVTFGSYNLTAGPARLTAGFDPNGHNYINVTNLYLTTSGIVADSNESHLHFTNVIVENAGTGFLGAFAGSTSVDITFDHCVFSHNSGYAANFGGTADLHFTNSMILSNAATDSLFSIQQTATLSIDYSLIQTVQVPPGSAFTDGGHNIWYPSPNIKAWPPVPPIAPIFVFTIDDSANIDSAYTFFTTVLDPVGIKGTLFVNSRVWTGAQATKLQTLAAEGHEIANHTSNHEDLTATQAFQVTSTNASPTVRVDKTGMQVILSTTTPGNSVTFPFTTSTGTIADLKTAIAGKSWTITNSVQNGKTRQDILLLDELADSSGTQAAPYTTLLDISTPNYKFWAHEINDNQDAIQALIGTRPTTFAYPFGFNSAGLITWLKTNTATHNLVTARIVGGAATSLSSVPKWQFIQRGYGWTTTDNEATVRAWARRQFFYAKSTPAYFLYYDHATTQAYWDRYGWMIDELQKLGAQFMTYGQLAAWIAADHADDGTNWTKTYTTTGADYHLLTGSPAIGAGTNTGVATDIMGVPYKATPSIGAYEYTGSSNSLMYSIP